jgi:hypothetical protein
MSGAWLGTASPRHYLLIRRHLSSGEPVMLTSSRLGANASALQPFTSM